MHARSLSKSPNSGRGGFSEGSVFDVFDPDERVQSQATGGREKPPDLASHVSSLSFTNTLLHPLDYYCP